MPSTVTLDIEANVDPWDLPAGIDGVVYLDHFEQALGNPENPHAMAQHYIGWALDVEARHRAHASGRGSRLHAAAAERGIGFETVRTWHGDRNLERKLKNRKNARALCPTCKGG